MLANRALVELDRTKHLTVDVLMTYLVHPGTALYVGYTDGYDNVALDPDGVRHPTRSPTTVDRAAVLREGQLSVPLLTSLASGYAGAYAGFAPAALAALSMWGTR